MDHSRWRVTRGQNSALSFFVLSFSLNKGKQKFCYHCWSLSEDRTGSSRAAAVTTCMDLYGHVRIDLTSWNAGVDDLIGSGCWPAIINFAKVHHTDLFHILKT